MHFLLIHINQKTEIEIFQLLNHVDVNLKPQFLIKSGYCIVPSPSTALLPGFPGFFVAGVFSGALSTVSGGLNSLAAVTLEDFVKVYYRNELTEQKATRLSKLLALFYGIFSYGLVFMVKNIPGLVQAWLGIFGVLGGPVLGLFSLGMFIPFANSTGALSGGIVSVVFMLWVSIGGNFSRLSGQTIYETKSLSIDDCPSAWNITEEVTKEPMPGKKLNHEFTNSRI